MTMLGRHTSVNDIRQWKPEGGTCLISISKQASFAPCAAPFAIAKLADLLDQGASIRVRFDYSDLDCTDWQSLFLSAPRVVSHLFGPFIAFSASSIVDKTGTELLEPFRNAIWSEVIRHNSKGGRASKPAGVFIGSQTASIVSRDPDQPIPECLRESGVTARPSAEKFRKMLLELAKVTSQTWTLGLKVSDPHLIKFLYEAFANAHEHGRVREAIPNCDLIRGISFEQITVYRSESVDSRGDLDGPLRDYIMRLRSLDIDVAGFFAITVMDLGRGIYQTLPATSSEESDWERFLRAFVDGQTSKPEGTDVELGEGLGNILDACSLSGGLLIASSGEQSAYFDGGVAGTTSSLVRNEDWAGCKRCGTTLTIVLPTFLFTPRSATDSQTTLFDEYR